MGLQKAQGLNPCCNGIYLIIIRLGMLALSLRCLNPCCNGIYLIMAMVFAATDRADVLILVVMEYT